MHLQFSGRYLSRAIALIALLLFFAAPAAVFAAKAARVGPPVVNPRGGVFLSNVVVTLASEEREIRYTLDGSLPGTNSSLYTGPIAVTNPVVLKAVSVSAGSKLSAVAAESYTFLDTNVVSFASTLPLVIIDTFGRAITPSDTEVTLHVVDTNGTQKAIPAGPAHFRGQATVKPRGYTSRRYPKRSLSVEIVDGEGEPAPASLLGMPKEEDWILYAPYPDKTLLRDVLAYELSNQLGRYASRTRFVEVFLNDTTNPVSRAHYAGVYVLEEKIKIAPGRLDMEKLSKKHNSEPEITGGYIFMKDHFEKAGPPSSDAARLRLPVLRPRYPSGPGGFPAPAAGFLPSTEEPALTGALTVVTNLAPVAYVLGGSNVTFRPPSVTVIRSNTVIITNLVSITNVVVLTNLVVSTNHVPITNTVVSSMPVVVTNPVVAIQSVMATNGVATTNQVDAQTAVITTTLVITTSSTYRTNFVIATNLVSVTNAVVATNIALATNSALSTNASIAAATVLVTNGFLVTNVFLAEAGEPLSPYAEQLLAMGGGFITGQSNVFFFVEPKAAKITDPQRAWLTNHLNRFEHALYGAEFRNPTNGYAAYIDVDSFIDHHLFVEATKNIDGFRFSAYFTKDRNGKIRMEPIWDWNLSMGLARGKQGYMVEHWYWPQLSDQQYPWFRRLFEDPDFGQRYVDRWSQWRTNVFSDAHLLRRIDEWAAFLKEPAARNFERWPILGQVVDAEYFSGKTYEEEIQYMKTWLTNRLAWIDAQFTPPPKPSRPGGSLASNDVITFSAPTGQIFFTIDGSDPRFAGGATSTVARVYQAPIAVSNSVSITARAQKDNRWSSPVTSRFIKTASR